MPDQDKKPPRWLGVRELRGNVSGYLQQVRRGQSFLVTSHNKVVISPMDFRFSMPASLISRH